MGKYNSDGDGGATPPKGGSVHQLALLLVLHGLRAVVCLRAALGERPEPHSSHLPTLKGKENG